MNIRRFLIRLFPSKEMREYYKMCRRHRREMVSNARKSHPWDWVWFHEMVMMRIRHMHEYYEANNNVVQDDESRLKIIEQLKHILDLNEEIDRMENDDFGVEYVEEDGYVKAVYPEDFKKKLSRWFNKEDSLYKEIYGYIGENLRQWWD